MNTSRCSLSLPGMSASDADNRFTCDLVRPPDIEMSWRGEEKNKFHSKIKFFVFVSITTATDSGG